MKVTIIAIGDELLIGQVTDTNSGAMAREMARYGWSVETVHIIGDNQCSILSAIETAMRHSSVVITTGGLGPTKDDITKSALCEYFGAGLIYNPDVAADVSRAFEHRGLKMNELTASQAMVPDKCRIIRNQYGTAPVMWFERDNSVLVSLPGVPRECVPMFAEYVMPALVERNGAQNALIHRTLLVHGISESDVAIRLATIESNLPESVKLAYLPAPGYLRMRLSGPSEMADTINLNYDNICDNLTNRLIAHGDVTPAVALVDMLRAKSLTVCTAESCTGGTISSRIVSVAGCSDVMAGGIVAYHNETKTRCLGVDPDILNTYGAVSEQTAIAMADGAHRAIGTDTVIVTTGIAGPSGGSTAKPVGTVWTARRSPKGKITATLNHFTGNRDEIIDRAANTAISQLILDLRHD